MHYGIYISRGVKVIWSHCVLWDWSEGWMNGPFPLPLPQDDACCGQIGIRAADGSCCNWSAVDAMCSKVPEWPEWDLWTLDQTCGGGKGEREGRPRLTPCRANTRHWMMSLWMLDLARGQYLWHPDTNRKWPVSNLLINALPCFRALTASSIFLYFVNCLPVLKCMLLSRVNCLRQSLKLLWGVAVFSILNTFLLKKWIHNKNEGYQNLHSVQ